MRATTGFLSFGLLTLGCAAEWPSNELVEARSAYSEASVSRAASFSEERLGDARRALDRAEGAYEAAPGTPEAKALAYVALRRAELAKVSGEYEFDRHIVAELETQRGRTGTQAPPVSSPQPSPTEPGMPADDATANGEQSLAAQHDSAELATLGEALSSLGPLVTLKKEEGRGTLVVLDSSFVFVPKKAEIADGARDELEVIARALQALGEGESLVVEGHTDSTGSDAQNLAFSKARADALVKFFVSHGIAADRIRAEGRGEGAPIATNDTAEGRALNRRIEIVIAKKDGP
jgi:OOP family OmpA-OmpF porin